MSNEYSLAELREHAEDVRAELKRETNHATREALNEELDETKRQLILAYARNPNNCLRGDGAGLASTTRRRDDGVAPHLRTARDQALRAIDDNLDAYRGDSADRVERLVRFRDPTGFAARDMIARSRPKYLSAFGKMLADPAHGHLKFDPEEVAAVREVAALEAERAMSIGTPSAGGMAIPAVLDVSVIASGAGATCPIRDIARTITISGARDWKGVSSDGVSASYVGEAVEATDGSPTLAQPEISTAQWRVFVPYSLELGADWPELQSELVRMTEDARNVMDATAFLTGNATNAPGGILNIGGTGGLTTTQRQLTANTTTFAIGDVYATRQALPARFASRATWAMHPTTADVVFRMTPSGSSTEPQAMPTRDGALIGRPVAEWSTMGTGTTAATKLLIYGDWSNYVVVDRLGTTAEIVGHLFGPAGHLPTGQRGLYVYGRTGAGCVVPAAFRYCEVKS